MAAVSDSEFNVLLAAAIKDYLGGWLPVDEELYSLCCRRPSQRVHADVFTKVCMIGRVYEAQIPRSFQAAGDDEVTVARGPRRPSAMYPCRTSCVKPSPIMLRNCT